MYIPFWLFPYLSHIKKKEIFIMRKEQITVTNNSVCNSAENKGLEGKGMKRRLLHFKKRMVPAVSGALMGVMLMSTTCFAAEFKDTYHCSHWCGRCHHSCKECYGVRTSLSAAGFIYHELRSERNCSRCHDGWYFNSSDILRLLRWGKRVPLLVKGKR